MKKAILSLLAFGILASTMVLAGIDHTTTKVRSPGICSVCDLSRESGRITLPEQQVALAGQDIAEVCTKKPPFSARSSPSGEITTTAETSTEKETEEASTTPLTPKEPSAPLQNEPTEPRMGDTRILDGQKQVFFLGVGWIDDNSESKRDHPCWRYV